MQVRFTVRESPGDQVRIRNATPAGVMLTRWGYGLYGELIGPKRKRVRESRSNTEQARVWLVTPSVTGD
jgi:hypothetical protein